MSPVRPIRSRARIREILFEWQAAYLHKYLMKSWFLFEWKTSA